MLLQHKKKEQKIIKTEKERKISVAVTNFGGKNISATESSIVSDLFRTELSKTKKYIVFDKTKMEIILAEKNFQYSSCTETSCAVEIGRLLNVEQTVFGIVAKVKETYYLTINFVDIGSGRILKSESVGVRDLREFPRVCKELSQKLSQE